MGLPLESLLAEAEREGVIIADRRFKGRYRALYIDAVITINTRFRRTRKKLTELIAEELGHHYTSSGDILDQSDIRKRKQELIARAWAYKRLIPLSGLISAYCDRISGRTDLADYFDVTERFFQAAIDFYKSKYGVYKLYGDRHLIYFDPLGVVELHPDVIRMRK
jgi:hypothetical protein